VKPPRSEERGILIMDGGTLHSPLLSIPVGPKPLAKESKEELGGDMPITKISPKHQITIPKEAFEKLRLEVGDFLEVEPIEEGLLLIPKKLISKDQAWFWTKEWQA